MFTGIITHLGVVTKNTKGDLEIQTPKTLLTKIKLGTSVSVNGICLTAVQKSTTTFAIQYMEETASKTNIGSLKKGDEVNLELSATAQTLIAGHIVQGHVDSTAKITQIQTLKDSWLFEFLLPQKIMKYIVDKGSIAINGISLTVITAKKNIVTVGIIPHTWEKTMLHNSKVGDIVNIEVDVLAKYLEKLTQK